MYAYKYNEDKYYAGQQECQIDPLESEKQGHPVYLLPADCTWAEPLNEKEGYKIKWNGKHGNMKKSLYRLNLNRQHWKK